MIPFSPLPRTLRVLLWLTTIVLLTVAFHIQDPHLKPVRAFAFPVVAVVSLICGILFYACGSRFQRYAGLMATTLAFAAGCYGHILPRIHKHAVETWQGDELRLAGAHFVIGFDDWNEARKLAAAGLIGGIYISRRNLGGETKASLGTRIRDLQTLRHEAGLPPLVIAADQEGGSVSHLSPLLPARPGLGTLADPGVSENTQQTAAFSAGAAHGSDLAGLGINVNFSPVVDLKPAHTPSFLDLNSRIGERAISADPHLVSRLAAAYVQGLASQNVTPTLKHFPGLGDVTTDTHHFSANLRTPVNRLNASDWRPFRDIARQSDALIMLAHVRLPEIDPRMPASLSRPIVQGIIRDGWRHQGVLITDDMSMAGAYNRGLCTAVSHALDAGVDLLLFSYDHEKIYDALYCAGKRLRGGALAPARLAASRARLAKLHRRIDDMNN